MPILSTRTDRKDEIARKLWTHLVQLKRRCDEAVSAIDTDRQTFVAAHQMARHLVALDAAIPAGVSDADLETLMNEIFGANAFTAADYRALIDTDCANLIQTGFALGPQLIAGDFNAAPSFGISLNASLSTNVRNQVLAALNAVIARYA